MIGKREGGIHASINKWTKIALIKQDFRGKNKFMYASMIGKRDREIFCF